MAPGVSRRSAASCLPTCADQPSVPNLDTNSALPIVKAVVYGPSVDGVSSVALSGGPSREIWVQVHLSALQTRGLGLNTVQHALQAYQLSQPAGSLVETGGYLRDVATISDTHAPPTSVDRYRTASTW